jgi:membrane-associated phospholipid phosphatase
MFVPWAIATWAIAAAPTAEAAASPTPPASTSPRSSRAPRLPIHPTPARWALDGSITAAAGIPYLVLSLGVAPHQPATPLGPAEDVGRLDRAAVGHFDPDAATAADAVVSVSVAAPLVYHAIEAALDVRRYGGGGRRFAGRFGTDALLLAEALAINGLLTEVLKSAVARPRPLSHIDPASVDAADRDELLDEQSKADRSRSFPSAHSSFAFTAATAGAMLLTLKPLGRRRRVAVGLAWGLGLSAATTVAVLRVAAGKHFPTDVIAGAGLGAGIGAAVVLAHLRPRRNDRVAVAPWRSGATTGLALTTVW